jgi:hypothetical protein
MWLVQAGRMNPSIGAIVPWHKKAAHTHVTMPTTYNTSTQSYDASNPIASLQTTHKITASRCSTNNYIYISPGGPDRPSQN